MSNTPVNPQFLSVPNLGGRNLGGGIQGFVAKPIVVADRSSENVIARRVLVKSWNTAYATQNVNGRAPITSPFRLVNNLGDYLGRPHYNNGGPNLSQPNKYGMRARIRPMFMNPDATGIPASTTNVKFVADSSEYIRFKKLRSQNRNFNDSTLGGDQHNASYFAMKGNATGTRAI